MTRTERQLTELYIPLLRMQRRGKQVFRMFLSLLGRNYVFNGKLNDREMEMWLFWAQKAFIPMNEQMVNLIVEKVDLIDGQMPWSFQRLAVHHYDFKAEVERYLRDGGEYQHPSNFPEDFEEDVLEQIGQLSLETGWAPKFLT